LAKYAQTVVEAKKNIYEAWGGHDKALTASLYLHLAAIFLSPSTPILGLKSER